MKGMRITTRNGVMGMDEAGKGRLVLDGRLNQTPDMSGYTIIKLTGEEIGYIRAYVDGLNSRIKELEKDNAQFIRELDNGLSRKERRIEELKGENKTVKRVAFQWQQAAQEVEGQLTVAEKALIITQTRIEELEEEVEEWKGGAETNFEALRMATEILNTAREALEKYADEKNWAADEGGYWSWPVPNPNDIMAIQKPWDIATRALEGMTNETSRSTKKSGHKSIHQKC